MLKSDGENISDNDRSNDFNNNSNRLHSTSSKSQINNKNLESIRDNNNQIKNNTTKFQSRSSNHP